MIFEKLYKVDWNLEVNQHSVKNFNEFSSLGSHIDLEKQNKTFAWKICFGIFYSPNMHKVAVCLFSCQKHGCNDITWKRIIYSGDEFVCQ